MFESAQTRVLHRTRLWPIPSAGQPAQGLTARRLGRVAVEPFCRGCAMAAPFCDAVWCLLHPRMRQKVSSADFNQTMVVYRAYCPSYFGHMATDQRSVSIDCPAPAQADTPS